MPTQPKPAHEMHEAQHDGPHASQHRQDGDQGMRKGDKHHSDKQDEPRYPRPLDCGTWTLEPGEQLEQASGYPEESEDQQGY